MKEIKTLEGWSEFAKAARETGSSRGDWDDYCKPGDYVSKEVFDHFLNILPPHSWKGDYLQVGEPYDRRKNPETGKFQNTYSTFDIGGIKTSDGSKTYMYLGNCFSGGKRDPREITTYESVQDFLKKTYRRRVFTMDDGAEIELPHGRDRVFCKDGFNISVQANDAVYCLPRENRADGAYTHVELGFPSEEEELIMEYADEPGKPKKSIYCYVPVEVVEKLIEKHGGWYESRMPVV